MTIKDTITSTVAVLINQVDYQTKEELSQHLEKNRPAWMEQHETDWRACCDKAIQKKLGIKNKSAKKRREETHLNFGFEADGDYTH